MKRTILLAALAAIVLSGCEKYDFSETENETETKANTREVQFAIKNISVDYGQTRATLASENMTDLWVYEGTTLLCHQTSEDDDFGAPTISLTIGAHDLTFVASKSDGQAFSDHWTCTKVKDTYGTVLEYTVSKSSTSKQVQLTRCNAKVLWTIEDAIPSDAATMTVTIGQNFGLDADLNGTDASNYFTSFAITSYVGRTGLTASVMALPASHEDGGDVTASISITDADDNSICHYENDITVYANQVCNIHGSFFQGNGAPEVSLLTDWGATTDYAIQ